MSLNHAIKQLEEKSVASEIELMVWSDRMDLVALSNVKGEVSLHRLTFAKAWSLNPPEDELLVRGIAWKPDGTIIAVAYSSGLVLLLEVDSKNICHWIETKCDISYLNWVQIKNTTKHPQDLDQNDFLKNTDFSSKFLTELNSQNVNPANKNEKHHILENQNELNLLLIGTTDGFVHITIFGCFPCITLDLNLHLEHKCLIKSIHLTDNFSKMFVTIRDIDNNVKIVIVDSSILTLYMEELFLMALKRAKLMSLVNYLSNTITTITETYESILLEMDNKLSKYASKVAEGGVTADFLDLLTFGICSNEMREFLIHDLTKKGLEKFGQTIEMNYSSIQKMLLKYAMKFGQNIVYHLAELRGMAGLEHRYKILGLYEGAITEAIASNGAFLIKTGEMQQIMNQSIINYKAFFRWLYTAIMHLMDEPVPNEIPKMTQQDLAYITEFLQNFDKIGSKDSKKSGFIMERLGQYLNDEPLKILPDMSGNDWSTFLTQNSCVQNNPSVLKHFEEMSLIQQYNHLKNSIENIFLPPKEMISQQFKFKQVFNCFNIGETELRMSQISSGIDSVLFAFLWPPDHIYVTQVNVRNENAIVKCGDFIFPQIFGQENFNENYKIVDLKYYSNTILSVLLQENNTQRVTILNQLCLDSVIDYFTVVNTQDEIFITNLICTINGSVQVPKLYKVLEGMLGSQLAVSGSRKVGIVLTENKRKVKLFEMEAEEEEEEDADMSNTTQRDNDSMIS